MSTIKSSAENLTLNADGANNDIKFQSNGSEVASIDQAGSLVLNGNLTSVGIDDNADALAITIDSSENVLVGGTDTGFAATKLKTGSYTKAESGINILTTATGTGYVLFGDGAGAASYSGGIHYNHNTSAMTFMTLANNERMRIDANGYVLTNKMATTYATLNGPSTNSNITSESVTAMVIAENPDSLYNTSNGRFTCPVDGLYFMSAMSINTASLNGTVQMRALKNDSEIPGIGRMYENQNHNHGGSGVSGFTRCSAGDYLQWAASGSIYAGVHSNATFALIHGET